MRPLRIVLPGSIELNLALAHLLTLCAAIAAACLLWAYVQLLHDSVAHGIQLRADRLAAAEHVRNTKPPARWAQPLPALPRLQQSE